ncbi:hypothetical protein OAJ82_00675 [Alphaproteobacteria bacterium]|nr:hypothetical protein [Alphaproteobacteria bacterium]
MKYFLFLNILLFLFSFVLNAKTATYDEAQIQAHIIAEEICEKYNVFIEYKEKLDESFFQGTKIKNVKVTNNKKDNKIKITVFSEPASLTMYLDTCDKIDKTNIIEESKQQEKIDIKNNSEEKSNKTIITNPVILTKIEEKKQLCLIIGYKAETEKFADCVLTLLTKD